MAGQWNKKERQIVKISLFLRIQGYFETGEYRLLENFCDLCNAYEHASVYDRGGNGVFCDLLSPHSLLPFRAYPLPDGAGCRDGSVGFMDGKRRDHDLSRHVHGGCFELDYAN